MPFVGKMITWEIACIIFYDLSFHTIQYLSAKMNMISSPNSVSVKEVIRVEREPPPLLLWTKLYEPIIAASLNDTHTQDPWEKQHHFPCWVYYSIISDKYPAQQF